LVGRDTSFDERLYGSLPVCRLTSDLSELSELLPQPGLEPADSQHAGRGVVECPRFGDQLAQLPELRSVETDVRATGQDQVLPILGERYEQLVERNQFPVDLDTDGQVELGIEARPAKRPATQQQYLSPVAWHTCKIIRGCPAGEVLYGGQVRVERHWWNGDRTTLGRRDVYIRTDGQLW
jgi:hypothetical protein